MGGEWVLGRGDLSASSKRLVIFETGVLCRRSNKGERFPTLSVNNFSDKRRKKSYLMNASLQFGKHVHFHEPRKCFVAKSRVE